jgi:hypothetical protein
MKRNKHASCSGSENQINKPWSVEIDLDHVHFSSSTNLGIDFYNSIDGWRNMEILLKHRSSRPHIKREYQDFSTIHYSVREKII